MKKLLLVARYYSIEPLGIMYLAGLARDEGWHCKVVLVRDSDFAPVYDAVRTFGPDLVGFQIWTGYHKQAFVACSEVRRMGVPVLIGGPHATYFDQSSLKHADYVVKAGGFGLLRKIMRGQLSPGIHFDDKGRAEMFPQPDRAAVYDGYPELGDSPIKSIFGSVGCPYKCTYCYAPVFNHMHGGFALTVRPVTELIAEAQGILARWPLRMVYFQDDIFGFDMKWLEEFARRWPQEVGVPFHCQIRLELVKGPQGSKRLDLFAKAGCTGITLAIESGNEFLRDHVLFRPMPDELIVEGCRKIMDRGMTLRTEQILAVPFSDTSTDLSTLALNNAINPTMAWTSILAPYGGTAMGSIASNFHLYTGTNDDLTESFFDRSVLRHVQGGPRKIRSMINAFWIKKEALLKFDVRQMGPQGPMGEKVLDVGVDGNTVGILHLLDDQANDKYCTDTVRLQRLFNWLSRVPYGHALGKILVEIPDNEWTWERIGQETDKHLVAQGKGSLMEGWRRSLASEMHLAPEELPEPIAQNPHYFTHLPAGGTLAHQSLSRGVFSQGHSGEQVLDALGTDTRRHLFHYDLYKIETGAPPIATQ